MHSGTNFASDEDVDFCKKNFTAANIRWLMNSLGFKLQGTMVEPNQSLRRNFSVPALTAALTMLTVGVAEKVATPFSVIETSLDAGATLDIFQNFMTCDLDKYLMSVHKPKEGAKYNSFRTRMPDAPPREDEKAKEPEQDAQPEEKVVVKKDGQEKVFNLVGSVVKTVSTSLPGLRFRGYEANRVYLAQLLSSFTKYVNGTPKPNFAPSLLNILGLGKHGFRQDSCSMAVWAVEQIKEGIPVEQRTKTLQGQEYVSALYVATCEVPHELFVAVMKQMDLMFPNLGGKKLSLVATKRAYAFPLTLPERLLSEPLLKNDVTALQAHYVLKECRAFRGQDRSEQGGLARCAYVGFPVSADIAEVLYYAADIARYPLPDDIAIMIDGTAATKGKQILTALKMLKFKGRVSVYGCRSCYSLSWLQVKGDNKFYSVDGLPDMEVYHGLGTMPNRHALVFDFRDVASIKTKDLEKLADISESVLVRLNECSELMTVHKNGGYVVALPACKEALPFSTGVKLHDLIVYRSSIDLPANGWWYNVKKDIGQYFYLTVLCNVARTVSTFSRKSFLDYMVACHIKIPQLYCCLTGVKKATFDTTTVVVDEDFLNMDVQGEVAEPADSGGEEDEETLTFDGGEKAEL